MERCTRCHGELQPLAVFCPHCAQAHEPDLGQLLGSEIGPPFGAQPSEGPRYRIYRRLGRGGLSTLFAATDLLSDRVVAIKVSDPSQLVKREMSYAMGAHEARAYWEEMIERMRREAETLATIEHPNIVRFYGAGMINDDLRYVVMEFLRGRTLREELDGLGRIEAVDAVRVGRDIAAALREVHGRGIIHRDISPQNIFIDCGIEEPAAMPASTIRHPNSIIKLIDFGIAKFPQPPGAPPFTHHSAISGTAAYASPEQCQSRPLDHRSDIYSLGVVLYEMLTGQRPFAGRTPTEIALKHIEAQPAPLRSINAALPGNLERTVLRAMAKSPDDRHQSAQELADDLRLGAQPIVIQLPAFAAAEIEEAAQPDEAAARPRRLGRAAFVAALLTILGVGWMFGSQALESLRSAVQARNASQTMATPSPSPVSSPAAGGSDADSMELAAARGAGGGAPPQPLPASPAASTGAANGSAMSRNPPPKLDKPAPVVAPPHTASVPVPSATPRPVAAPTPTPTPAPRPASPPPPATERPREVARAGETQTPAAPAAPAPGPPAMRPPREEPPVVARTQPPPQRPSATARPDPMAQDDEEDEEIGPRLIQWNGTVNGQRQIRIEMPGVPGRIEIPRVYRDRVAIVEPPNADTGWRVAVLRIYGNGHVSFTLRWWPSQRMGHQ